MDGLVLGIGEATAKLAARLRAQPCSALLRFRQCKERGVFAGIGFSTRVETYVLFWGKNAGLPAEWVRSWQPSYGQATAPPEAGHLRGYSQAQINLDKM
jgi:hypothetical protein